MSGIPLSEAQIQRQTLHLVGPIPCKKSKYRRGRAGLFLDAGVVKQIDALVIQARTQWRRDPIKHPDMRITFRARHRRADRDGMLATLMDVLQKAGVIRNDNVAHCNGRITLEPTVIGNDEGVTVSLGDVRAVVV